MILDRRVNVMYCLGVVSFEENNIAIISRGENSNCVNGKIYNPLYAVVF